MIDFPTSTNSNVLGGRETLPLFFFSFSIQGWTRPCFSLPSLIVGGRVRSGASSISRSSSFKTEVFLAFFLSEVAPHADIRVARAPGAWIPAKIWRLDARWRRASYHHRHCLWRMKSFTVVLLNLLSAIAPPVLLVYSFSPSPVLN